MMGRHILMMLENLSLLDQQGQSDHHVATGQYVSVGLKNSDFLTLSEYAFTGHGLFIHFLLLIAYALKWVKNESYMNQPPRPLWRKVIGQVSRNGE